jgi:hypothetical protein
VTELKEEITMRHASFFLSALVLVTMLGTAHAAPASIEGSWSGSGIARHQGGTDRIICRVNYGRSTGKSFTVLASCSTGRGNYELSGRVASAGTNRYSGWIHNARFNDRGNVQMHLRGGRLSVAVTSGRGTANLTLSRR